VGQLPRKYQQRTCSLIHFLHALHQLSTLHYVRLLRIINTPLLYVILKPSYALEASRSRVGVTEGQYSLQFSEIFNLRYVASLAQPGFELLSVSVSASPLTLLYFFDISPPPRINIEMVYRFATPWRIQFRRTKQTASIKAGKKGLLKRLLFGAKLV